MLNCRDMSERAGDFLDARLPFRVRVQMWMHLLMCRFCREYLRQLSLVVRTLRVLPRSEPPDHATRELLAVFRTEAAR